MHRDVVAAGFRKRFQIRIARRDHQMCVENLSAVRTHGLDHVWTVGNVRDEVPVHDVKMDPVGAGSIDRAHLFAEFCEIRSQDRRRYDEWS